ncbi:MAG TPA: nuclear transport factor 2 family protein [Pseudolabrys sp.]|nr:nuclear transport factor 2 family protein [Pseudolabrys sp.]
MTEPVSRATVEAFYRAYSTRDLARTADYLADDVAWSISGPVDVLSFCGVHQGKAAVIDMMARVVPQVFDIIKFEPSTMLLDGDRVATLNRLTARHHDDGRMISYRLAHFMRFHDGKVAENISLLDSFDAVEQVLGHALAIEPHERECADGDLVAV